MAGWREKSGLSGTVYSDTLPLNVLLHCRTVVEKQNFVSTGVMTHVEGELFEVELPEFHVFDLGETVKLTVYSPAGIQTFPSTVFAKYQGAIALIQPPQIQKRFEEKREHPRVNVEGSVHIDLWLDDEGQERTLDDPLEIQVRDISVSGIAFQAPVHPELLRTSRMKAKVEIGIGFDCELEIVRRNRSDDQMVCGAKMTVLDPEMLRPLRALILRQQVERNVQIRQEREEKNRFGE
ncbi:PilZ domain-containing protein [Cohnella pontilimi]|uniref:PilZ domain-containing protein n=1 Tax=Cohnella pontilimi TaxID=2564100 RepID=A0A4U0F6I9_9BACL|nr:PilZ domain-containing protein [Cohnella pontilimi]TJY38502.1 PilZ domain-containing protein [Cohnella pontilimi]